MRMINDPYKSAWQSPQYIIWGHIFVLVKKGKDNTYPANYRPLSLIYFDQKVITKVLAYLVSIFQQ